MITVGKGLAALCDTGKLATKTRQRDTSQATASAANSSSPGHSESREFMARKRGIKRWRENCERTKLGAQKGTELCNEVQRVEGTPSSSSWCRRWLCRDRPVSGPVLTFHTPFSIPLRTKRETHTAQQKERARSLEFQIRKKSKTTEVSSRVTHTSPAHSWMQRNCLNSPHLRTVHCKAKRMLPDTDEQSGRDLNNRVDSGQFWVLTTSIDENSVFSSKFQNVDKKMVVASDQILGSEGVGHGS